MWLCYHLEGRIEENPRDHASGWESPNPDGFRVCLPILHRSSQGYDDRTGNCSSHGIPTLINLTSVGGSSNGWIHDSQFYEIEIVSNDVVFSWSAWNHPEVMPIADSYTPLDAFGTNQSDPWDFAHLKSIMRYGKEYIVSSHGFCSIYAIDKNLKLKWTLEVGVHPPYYLILLTDGHGDRQ